MGVELAPAGLGVVEVAPRQHVDAPQPGPLGDLPERHRRRTAGRVRTGRRGRTDGRRRRPGPALGRRVAPASDPGDRGVGPAAVGAPESPRPGVTGSAPSCTPPRRCIGAVYRTPVGTPGSSRPRRSRAGSAPPGRSAATPTARDQCWPRWRTWMATKATPMASASSACTTRSAHAVAVGCPSARGDQDARPAPSRRPAGRRSTASRCRRGSWSPAR